MEFYDFKNIHIGELIRARVKELNIDISRISNFFKFSEDQITLMYDEKDLGTDVLLKWSKLLEYDFFRLYSQHLIIYSPPSSLKLTNTDSKTISQLPQLKKSLYTKEIIDFILEMIKTKKKTKVQVIEEYKIPKTTLYKWLTKYNK